MYWSADCRKSQNQYLRPKRSLSVVKAKRSKISSSPTTPRLSTISYILCWKFCFLYLLSLIQVSAVTNWFSESKSFDSNHFEPTSDLSTQYGSVDQMHSSVKCSERKRRDFTLTSKPRLLNSSNNNTSAYRPRPLSSARPSGCTGPSPSSSGSKVSLSKALSNFLILLRRLNFACICRVFDNNEYDGCAGWATAGLGYS